MSAPIDRPAVPVPPPVPLPDSLARWPGFLLSRTSQAAAAYYEASMAELGLRRRHVSVLILLDDLGPLRQVRIGELLVLGPASVAHVVDDLVLLDAVRRGPDPTDRRARRIELTGRGREHLRRAEELSAALSDEYFSVLDAAERRQLIGLLVRLARRSVDARP